MASRGENFSVEALEKGASGGDIRGRKEFLMKAGKKEPRVGRPTCPRCGEPARVVWMTARVSCDLGEDGEVGRIRGVGRRIGKAVYECGGGHTFEKDARCTICGKKKDNVSHIKYGPDLDDPRKHEFKPRSEAK